MFVRFQSPFPGRRGVPTGVFGLVNTLARRGLLSADEWSFWRNNNDWFNATLAAPGAVVYDARLHPRATAWFKPSATHLLARVPGYLAILDAHGVDCVRVESTDPGVVIYEDDVQVVVEPLLGG